MAPPLVVTTLWIPAELAAATKEMKLEFAKGPCLNFQKIILKQKWTSLSKIFLNTNLQAVNFYVT